MPKFSAEKFLPASLAAHFEDAAVEEILINGQTSTCVRLATGESRTAAAVFRDQEALLDWLFDFVHRQGMRLDVRHPAAGGTLGDGTFRWHALLPVIAPEGPLVSVRRHQFDHLNLADFLGCGADGAALWDAYQHAFAVVVAGATASGKTSLLAALLREWSPHERVVILESLAELPLCSPHWVRLVARPPDLSGRGAVSVGRLLEESLRLRPDRLVIGEVRGPEARVFAEAALTGHGGVITTMHASSADEVRARLSALLPDRGLLEQVLERLVVVSMKRAIPRGIARIESYFLPKSSPKKRFTKPKKPGEALPALASPVEVPL